MLQSSFFGKKYVFEILFAGKTVCLENKRFSTVKIATPNDTIQNDTIQMMPFKICVIFWEIL